MSSEPQTQLQPQPQPQLGERSAILRQELKAWEKSFADAHNGRKAGRDDIKRDRSIASKYKEYNRLRDQLSKEHKIPSKSGPSTTAKRRKVSPRHARTPQRLPPSTPSREIHPTDLDPYDSPLSVRKLLFVDELRTSIGPTPQKNGTVLGLFDLLEDTSGSPLQKRKGPLLHGNSNVQATPQKSGAGAEGRCGWKSGGSTPVARTPASSGKRRLYESFNTPLKRKLGDTDGGASVSDVQFATPSFLRRDQQGASMFLAVGGDGEADPVSPVIRMPARPPVRGLSSMLARLRQMEDEALDEEMDVLRELEEEITGQQTKPPYSVAGSAPTMLAEGGQTAPSARPLNNSNNAEAMGSGEDEPDEKPTLGRDGKPLKVWKKKGQKRTTKRVILRPVRIKPKSIPEPNIDDSSASEDKVQATSATNAATSRSSGKDVTDEDDDDERSDFDESQKTSKERHTAKDSNKAKPEGTKESLVKRTVRKISTQAHANYRRLKLRSKGPKGTGGGGRFGFKRRR
ncbi:MAG: DNA replication regulator sld2 [Geoglossum umbratile]|nr:MAG: DNA replication regulator sld2 [Geoglossum umbratile]